MPIHDWTKVRSGLFHNFHQQWITAICTSLNRNELPPEYFALQEQTNDDTIPDVLTLQLHGSLPKNSSGGVALLEPRPTTRVIQQTDEDIFAAKADRIRVESVDGEIVAVIEIISPGNKHSIGNFKKFVEKSVKYIRSRVSVMVVDLFPPTPRDPHGIHAEIWDQFEGGGEHLSDDENRCVVSYEPGDAVTAFMEPLSVGRELPDMPLFLGGRSYIKLELQPTYDIAWESFPDPLKPKLI